jgi:hypothetical protein
MKLWTIKNDDAAGSDVHQVPRAKSQHEPKNPTRRFELKKPIDMFKEFEDAKRN